MERKEIEVVLFGVNHEGDLKREYPGLDKIEEFKDLDPKKVRFCWLVGNRTSPIFKLDRWDRIRKALKIVWGETHSKNPTIQDIVKAKDESELPDDILKGIYRMNMFNPGYRLKAKLMAEYIFETLNELIVVDSVTMMSMDIDDRKKYADLAIKVSSELNGMVERIESSYGVKTIDRETKDEIQVNINDLMH
jgi:hypothetical protein